MSTFPPHKDGGEGNSVSWRPWLQEPTERSPVLADPTLGKQGIYPGKLPLTLCSAYGRAKTEWSRVVSHGGLCPRSALGLSGRRSALWLLWDPAGHFHGHHSLSLCPRVHPITSAKALSLWGVALLSSSWIFHFTSHSLHLTQKSDLVIVKILCTDSEDSYHLMMKWSPGHCFSHRSDC